jgi:type II secretory ATPase GspE/PulE/Tfp pilus assembly ATPase PilB-like protein
VLLTGPAGSGKTTTLYALINGILRRSSHAALPTTSRVHVITVEDPVESVLTGVTQTQVNLPGGLTYAAALRSLLRQDPEVVMVGEIRDRETAEIVTQAGLTGHLVLSTLHGGNVASVITRLLEMGLEPYVITSSLKAVLAMRLVRRLCVNCHREGPRVPLRISAHVHETTTFDAVGCAECGGTGFRGRLPVVEFTTVLGELKNLILRSEDSDALERQLHAEHVRTLLEHGVELIETGRTSLDELRRVLGPIEMENGTR